MTLISAQAPDELASPSPTGAPGKFQARSEFKKIVPACQKSACILIGFKAAEK
jgi:hypothetical protein